MSAPKDIHCREGIRLAPLDESHAESMFSWVNDPDVRENIGLRREPTLGKTREWIRNACERSDTHARAILFDDVHVGNVILDRIDLWNSTARLSIYVGDRSMRHRGIGLTACYLMLREGFLDLRLHKVWLTVHSNHDTAQDTYRKLGFRQEGVLRDEFVFQGRRVDCVYMGLLRHEFEALAVHFPSCLQGDRPPRS